MSLPDGGQCVSRTISGLRGASVYLRAQLSLGDYDVRGRRHHALIVQDMEVDAAHLREGNATRTLRVLCNLAASMTPPRLVMVQSVEKAEMVALLLKMGATLASGMNSDYWRP
jgi:hypothetical protein